MFEPEISARDSLIDLARRQRSAVVGDFGHRAIRAPGRLLRLAIDDIRRYRRSSEI